MIRLLTALLMGVALPQLLGVAGRGLAARPSPLRLGVGVSLPAITFFVIAISFFNHDAAEIRARTGRPPCGAYGAAAEFTLFGGLLVHAALAAGMHLAIRTLSRRV